MRQVETILYASLVGGIATATYLLRPIRLLRVDDFCNSVYWTARSWLWNSPVAAGYDVWNVGDPNIPGQYDKDRARLIRVWDFLRPHFASRGYHLYSLENPKDIFTMLYPTIPLAKELETEKRSFPFAERFYKQTADAQYCYHAPCVWPARDRKGRDVVIKAISGPNATRELCAIKLLNSDALRDEPRNHTIPILDYVTFIGQVFIVMPRWDCAFLPDFIQVAEFVRYGQGLLEALAFLHENNITHGDIHARNTVMDVLVPLGWSASTPPVAGLRGPERKYAFIDFETAAMWQGVSLDATQPIGRAGELTLEQARKHDVHDIADLLEMRLRCIEDVLPELGSLLDSMKDRENVSQPTASAALTRFEEMCKSLSVEDLQRQAEAISWSNGKIAYRKSPPLFIS